MHMCDIALPIDKVKTKIQYYYAVFVHFSIASLLPLQIVGEIKAARDAVVEVTSRLRSYLYRDFFQRDIVPPSASLPGFEASSSNNISLVAETSSIYQNVQSMAAALPSKVLFCHFHLQYYPSLLLIMTGIWSLGDLLAFFTYFPLTLIFYCLDLYTFL